MRQFFPPGTQLPQTTTSGKLVASAVESRTVEQGNIDSFWSRAVGNCLKWDIRIGGEKIQCLVDTGSQVTTVKESWFRQYLQANVTKSFHSFSLTAANGLEIPTVGCFVCSVEVQDQTVEDCVIVVVKDNPQGSAQPQCLLGMNVLQRINTDLGQLLLRSPKNDVVVPANSIMHICATTKPNKVSCNVLVEPSSACIRGLTTMPTFTTLTDGKVRIPVLNTTDDDLILPARSLLGIVCEGNPAHEVTIHQVNADADCSGTDGTSSPLRRGDPVSQTAKPGESFVGTSASSVDADINRLNWGEDLSPGELAQLKELLRKHHSTFAFNDADLGYTNIVQHEIHLTTDVPIAQSYRRIPPAVLPEVKAHISDLISRGIIAPSSSPYASPIVVVRKKSGEIRLCVDYRRLNAVTRKDSFPLPRIDESLDALGGARFFSTLDLASGYYQVEMAETDKAKTAFICPFGLYHFNRMPFGLTNAPATFQRLMNQVMSDFIFSCLLVYLDDLLVYSSTFEKHLKALETVLDKLKEVGVRLNPDKCSFVQKEVPFLGHIVSADGIATDPSKTRAIENWPVPENVSQVRSFLGLASYYRRFVPDFSKIAKPLTALYNIVHKENTKDRHHGERKPLGPKWTTECSEAFYTLKRLLTSPPILSHPDFTLPFILEVDTSFQGIGAVLSQRIGEKTVVIAYASRSLRMSEATMKNYSSFKLELLGLKWAVAEKFRGYLLGHSFEVFTDNNALAHLDNTKLAATEQRWVSEMAAVGEMKLHFRSGKMNRNADALSRQPVDAPVGPGDEFVAVSQIQCASLPISSTFAPYPLPPDPILSCQQVAGALPPVPLHDEMTPLDWKEAQQNDETLATIIYFVKQGRPPNSEERKHLSQPALALLRHFEKFKISNGLLTKSINTGVDDHDTVVIPKEHQQQLLHLAHDSSFHQGQERTYQLLQARCFWHNMKADVETHIKQCRRCLTAKEARTKVYQPMGHLRASRPLEIIAIDFLKLDRAANGLEDVLIITDIFTKYTIAVPTKDQKATTVVQALHKHWIVYFGAPMRVHSDQGRNFESQLVQGLCQLYDIAKTRTTPYHPQGNGQCERFNRTLISLLSTLEPEAKRNWPSYLPEATFAYNTTPHSTTGLSPYALMFGREPRTPLDVLLGTNTRTPATSGEAYLEQHQKRIMEMRQKVLAKQEHASKPPSRPRATVDLSVGDEVLKKQHPHGRHKLSDHYHSTPAIVIDTHDGRGSFTIQFPDGKTSVEHGSNLRRLASHYSSPPSDPTVPIPIPDSQYTNPPTTRYEVYEPLFPVPPPRPIPRPRTAVRNSSVRPLVQPAVQQSPSGQPSVQPTLVQLPIPTEAQDVYRRYPMRQRHKPDRLIEN